MRLPRGFGLFRRDAWASSDLQSRTARRKFSSMWRATAGRLGPPTQDPQLRTRHTMLRYWGREDNRV